MGIAFQVYDFVFPSLADVVCSGLTIYGCFVCFRWLVETSVEWGASPYEYRVQVFFNGTAVAPTNVGGGKVIQ